MCDFRDVFLIHAAATWLENRENQQEIPSFGRSFQSQVLKWRLVHLQQQHRQHDLAACYVFVK